MWSRGTPRGARVPGPLRSPPLRGTRHTHDSVRQHRQAERKDIQRDRHRFVPRGHGAKRRKSHFTLVSSSELGVPPTKKQDAVST